ncbi:MAG TPA: hypothetical protein VJU78_02650 [Chitinophagaceae bacterium]|nr:hypothetical protein [Chitinophagaceae bacterium]
MKTVFYIDLSLKTPRGPEPYARFYIGNNREQAYELFNKLTGSVEINENDMLFIDFMEMRKGLPVNLTVISCTLEQLTKNCRIITKTLFQSANLKAS